MVENSVVAAVFRGADGRVTLHAKEPGAAQGGPGDWGRMFAELSPLSARANSPNSLRCEILRNAGDEIIVEAFFAAGTPAGAPTVAPGAATPAAEVSAVFVFGRNEIVEIKPSARMKGMRLRSPIDRGVVPGFVGDDLILAASDFPGTDLLTLPVDTLFLGLLKGENRELVLTWPKGRQQARLVLAAGEQAGAQAERSFEALEFENDGQSFHLAALSAPGIWHREELKPALLEKSVALARKRPFPARWKTQLLEAGVKTTFAFRETKGEIWRGVPGSYSYPVWFEQETAFLHLSKKVPPKGESLIYCLEPQDTPPAVATPVDVLKATLGRAASATILDAAGRRLRTHHRRGGDGVHRACTCGCTEAIQAVFERSLEVSRREDVKEALGDMNYFVQQHVDRIEEYRQFAAEVLRYLGEQKTAASGLKEFVESLEPIAQQIPQEYDVQKENMKSMAHAGELTRQTLALTASRSTNNLAAYMEMLKAWRAMGGAQDYVVAQCHGIARKLFQEAGYTGLRYPDAAAQAVAQEVRTRCRRVLRNPDGYEIWANY